jgi:hypothetical protein
MSPFVGKDDGVSFISVSQNTKLNMITTTYEKCKSLILLQYENFHKISIDDVPITFCGFLVSFSSESQDSFSTPPLRVTV